MQNKVTIFVFTHFLGHDDLPQVFQDREIYKSIQCGSAINKMLNTTYRDDFGKDNISEYNKYLNEMTGMYWIGKHLEDVCDTEYIGFMHYRRYLTINNIILSPNTIYCPIVDTFNTRNYQSILEWSYECHHDYKNWDKVIMNMGIDKKISIDIMKFLQFNSKMPCCNMFISNIQIFKRYITFMTPIILKMCQYVDDSTVTEEFNALSKYQQRFYGFIMERITGYWIEKQKRYGIDVNYCKLNNINIKNKENGWR